MVTVTVRLVIGLNLRFGLGLVSKYGTVQITESSLCDV